MQFNATERRSASEHPIKNQTRCAVQFEMVVRAAIINSFVAHNFPLMVIGFLDLINFEVSPRSTGLVQNGDKVADHLIQDSPHIDRGHYKHQGDCISNTVKNL